MKNSEDNQKKPYDGKQNTKGISGLFYSFRYAAKGIYCVFREERNIRIHSVSTFFLFVSGFLLEFSFREFAQLGICCGLIMMAEMFNTALEAMADALHPEYGEKIGFMKDVAAGAVLLISLAVIPFGIHLFFLNGRFLELLTILKNNMLITFVLLILAVYAVLIIKGVFIKKLK